MQGVDGTLIDLPATTDTLDLIDSVGPLGNYLANEHTVKYCRSESWNSRYFAANYPLSSGTLADEELVERIERDEADSLQIDHILHKTLPAEHAAEGIAPHSHQLAGLADPAVRFAAAIASELRRIRSLQALLADVVSCLFMPGRREAINVRHGATADQHT